MASPWIAIGISLGTTFCTWLLSPIISFHLNKFLSDRYDASQKLRDLESDTIPKLKFAVSEVEKEWIAGELRGERANVVKPHEQPSMLKKLKAALYEVEDILDLIDYHRIEKELVGDGESHGTSWLQWCWQRLYDSIQERSAPLLMWTKQSLYWLWQWVRVAGEKSAPLLMWAKQSLCWLWQWVRVAGEKSAPLLKWAKQSLCWLWRWVRKSGALLPISCAPPSSSFDFNIICTSIFNWLAVITKTSFNWLTKAYEFARYHRDLSCEQAGYTSYQDVGMEANCTIMGPLYIRLKENKKKIEKLIDKAQQTISFKKKVQETIEQANQPRRNETADPIGKVTGRDESRVQITKMLRDTENVDNTSSSGITRFSAIGVFGIPGSGKTTLAQYVCKFEEKDGYFDLVMWIPVSQNFSVDTIYREMYNIASGKECPQHHSLDFLRKELEKVLDGKRYLLVLDDIWCNKEDGEQRLPQLLSPLKFGNSGSKILVTTRNKLALDGLGPDVSYTNFPIPDLDDKVFLKLFMYYALGSKTIDPRDRGSLVKIGTEIAKKLKKSPLLARVVGGVLRQNQNVNYWTSVREQKLLDHNKGMVLWWSYQHLDEQVRRCFAYCSIFPRRDRLRRDELVNLWVAEGFTNTPNRAQEMEFVGQGYFDELLSASFLQPGGKDYDGEEYFLIHDLLYDLAEKVAGSDCFKIKNGSTERAPPDVLHLSIESCNSSMITEDIVKLKKLRTLIIYNGEDDMSEEVFDKIFSKLCKLRVLIFQTTIHDHKISCFSFPKSIGYLKHLHYLGFQISGIPLITLPGTLSKLYLLQVLDSGFGDIKFHNGEDMINLINLRHVMSKQFLNFPNIGRLTSVQTIPALDVGREEQGYELHQLKNLNKLQGKLEISGLENVESKEEALEANLADKEGLKELGLYWNIFGSSSPPLEVQADVLDSLCPPAGLRYLRIIDYDGSRYPSWMVGTQKSTIHLDELDLCRCSQLVPAPAPELFFITVSSLAIRGCHWDTLPYNMEHLTSLEFEGCDLLPENMRDLKSLERLIIRYCFNIRRLPALPKSLDYIEIKVCINLRGYQNWEKITDIPHKNIDDWLFYDSDDKEFEDPATGSGGRARSSAVPERDDGGFSAERDSGGPVEGRHGAREDGGGCDGQATVIRRQLERKNHGSGCE